MSFIDVMGRRGFKKGVKHAIVAAMLGGEIQVFGSASTGTDELFLLRRQVEELRRGWSGGGRTPSRTFTQAALLLGLGHKGIDEAIKAGLLVEASSTVGRRVTAESVDRFRQDRLVLRCGGVRQPKGWRNDYKQIGEALGIEVVLLPKGRGGQVVIPRAREEEVVTVLRMRREAKERVRRTKADVARAKADMEQRCVATLGRYVDELKRDGRFLPRRNCIVNCSQITRDCGFNKNVWGNYPALKRVLEIADREELKARGLEGCGPVAFLRGYLRQLAERNEPLPMRSKGAPAPSEVTIARLVGISASVFGREPMLRKLVQDYRKTWEARNPSRFAAGAGKGKAFLRQGDSA